MMKYLYFFLLTSTVANGENPITPPSISMADPAAHVWKDENLIRILIKE